MLSNPTAGLGGVALAIWLLAAPVLLNALPAGNALAAEETPAAMNDLVNILHQEGVIDEEQFEQLTMKASSVDAAKEDEAWYEKLQVWGDARMRWEGFIYDEDSNNRFGRSDRSRVRYRLRLNLKAPINDHITFLTRFRTGNDSRSSNQSLGRPGPDFDQDPIFVDKAYLQITPFAGGDLPNGDGYWDIEIGKMGNPFLWKQSRDWMLWDSDITLEGIQTHFKYDLGESAKVFFNTGYYIDQENTSNSDPDLFGVQGGGHLDVAKNITVGGRTTYYRFGDLDNNFISRGAVGTNTNGSAGSTSSAGNILDGLTGGFNDETLDVIEGAMYVNFDHFEDWPINIYADVANNLSASASDIAGRGGEESWAWGTGIRIGHKKKYLEMGASYWHIEANAFPSQFIDSDLFDGVTNREGWSFFFLKQVLSNTDFKIEGFVSDNIQVQNPPFGSSLPGANRWRLRGDVIVKF